MLLSADMTRPWRTRSPQFALPSSALVLPQPLQSSFSEPLRSVRPVTLAVAAVSAAVDTADVDAPPGVSGSAPTLASTHFLRVSKLVLMSSALAGVPALKQTRPVAH